MMQRGEGGDEYASGYDVQLTLTFTMRPIYPVKTGKVDPDERLTPGMGYRLQWEETVIMLMAVPPSPTLLLVHAALGRTDLGIDRSKYHEAKCTNLKLQCSICSDLYLMLLDCKLMANISTPS